jgi:hypothetical protein
MSASRTPTSCPCAASAAALARGDGDHPRPGGQLDAPGLDTAAQAGRERSALVRRHHVEAERDRRDVGERPDVLPDLLFEAGAKRAADDGERDRDDDVGALDLDRPHHVQLRDRAAQLGVDHAAQCFQNPCLQDLLARRHGTERSACGEPGARSGDRQARPPVD